MSILDTTKESADLKEICLGGGVYHLPGGPLLKVHGLLECAFGVCVCVRVRQMCRKHKMNKKQWSSICSVPVMDQIDRF